MGNEPDWELIEFTRKELLSKIEAFGACTISYEMMEELFPCPHLHWLEEAALIFGGHKLPTPSKEQLLMFCRDNNIKLALEEEFCVRLVKYG